ncbi:RNA polymerase sigma factor [Chloroflexota bacterium]
MNESKEAALVRRYQSGDEEAFRMLVEQYRSALFGTAFLMTRDRGLAEDAVQETLVQMWKHLPSLRIGGSIKIWLIRIVVNEVKQQFRKKRVPTVPLELVAEEMNGLNEVETAIMRDEEHQQIKQALEMLPSEQREAVVLRYFSELTVPEVARVLGKREGTVKSRLSRALDRLGEILRGDIEREGGR